MTRPTESGPEEPRIDLYAPRDERPKLERGRPARRRRRGYGGLIVTAAVIVALGAGGWYAVNSAVDPARLKGEIERSVTHATGRQFTIQGPLHVVLGWAPSLTAENISLANVAGGTRPQMLTATSLTAQVALLPLLSGEVVVEQVTLTKPDVLLEQGEDGTPNWQFRPLRRPLFGGPASGAPDAAPREQGGSHVAAVQIHALRFDGGHITWRPAGASIFGRERDVDIQRLDATAEGEDAPINAKLTGSIDSAAGDSAAGGGAASGGATSGGVTSGGVPFTATVHTGAYERLEGGPVTLLAGAWPLLINVTSAGAVLKIDGGINHPDEMRGYTFLLTANAPDLTPFAPLLPRPLALPLHDVNLTVRLTDGSNGEFHTEGLSLHAGAADLSSAVLGLVLKDAVFSAPGPGQQAQLSVQGQFDGAPLRLVGTTTQPDVLAANVPVPLAFSGQVASATISARGTVPSVWGLNGLDLQVSVRTPTLADLSPLAGRPLPDIRDVVFESHLGDAGFRLHGVDARELNFTSSLGELAGHVTFAWSPVPTLNGTLTSKHFDVDAAQAAWTAFTSAAPGAPALRPNAPGAPAAAPGPDTPATTPDATANRVFSDTPLPFGALHGADADLTLVAGSLTIGHETYRDLNVKLLANDGKLILNPLRVTAPQGLLTGALSLDASIDPPPVAMTLRSPSMSAGGLAAALGYPGAASGAVQLDAQLSGVGTTPHALAASVTGHFGMTMVNGTVTDAVLEGALGAALDAAGVPPIGGSTDVRCFALRTDFHHGQGEVQALSLDTSRLSLDGDGTVDLGDETLALHLRPVVRVGGSGVAAPVLLHGGFHSLKASLEPAMDGGRFGLTIGGPAPNDNACVGKLADARGGLAGPMPAAAPMQAPGNGKHKKPADLLRGLFH